MHPHPAQSVHTSSDRSVTRAAMTGVLTAVALALVLLPGVASAQGTKLVGNIDRHNDGDADAFLNQDLAQFFTTGSHSAGYTLTSMQVAIGINGSNRPAYTATIQANTASGVPSGTALGTLAQPDLPDSGVHNFWYPSEGDGISLDPGTTYWIVFDAADNSTTNVWITGTNDDADGS